MENKENLIEKIRIKYEKIKPHLNEKTLRIWAALEAVSIGRGGITTVSFSTTLSRTTIHQGIRELECENCQDKERIRQTGGGRKKLIETDETLITDLQRIVETSTLGDPESPLLWTSKSTTKIAEELKKQGHKVSQRSVYDLLDSLGYSLQGNKKTKEGSTHEDRDEQFQFISREVKKFQENLQPVISVDAKKKELIGEFKNSGREWQNKGNPVEVNVYDFIDKELGKAAPYGIYDITANKGWVNVGIDHDTSEFAVESIRRWWYGMGKSMYPDATEILITADGGGSNGSRVRLWKYELQKLADEIRCNIQVCHFPPGTSKWNKIEHRMFSYISINWRGKPLTSHEVIINLISNTKTNAGLEIKSVLDKNRYETGKKISDEELELLNIKKLDFHGEWNYILEKRH
jgi:transposase